MIATDETNITEIELMPDGRICVFGTSLEVLDVLDQVQGGTDPRIQQRKRVAEVVRLQSENALYGILMNSATTPSTGIKRKSNA